jgi:hypothetical protein
MRHGHCDFDPETLGGVVPDKETDVLRPRLIRAELSLKRALDEVCHVDVHSMNTGELIRIEEVLAIANEAAKEAVSMRRKLSQRVAVEAADANETSATRSTATPTTTSAAATADERTRREESGLGAQREFEDARGVRWIAFAVHPSSTRVTRSGLRTQYKNGWLAFDSGVETRRLAPIPPDWAGMSIEDLRSACERAEVAPKRHPRAK